MSLIKKGTFILLLLISHLEALALNIREEDLEDDIDLDLSPESTLLVLGLVVAVFIIGATRKGLEVLAKKREQNKIIREQKRIEREQRLKAIREKEIEDFLRKIGGGLTHKEWDYYFEQQRLECLKREEERKKAQKDFEEFKKRMEQAIADLNKENSQPN